MMRIALLSPGYPSVTKHYDFAFVHARAKLYRSAGYQVRAFSLASETNEESFEGVDVVRAPGTQIHRLIEGWAPDVVGVHAPYFRVIWVARNIRAPQVAWIHG